MHSKESGAEIQARSPKSSIDLATLVDLIAKALSPNNLTENADKKDPKYKGALIFQPEDNRLRLCTSAVLHRLFSQPEFKKAFNPTKGDGFIQNLPMPAYGTRSRIGGCLTEGNAAKLPAALDRLIAAIDQAIDTALPQEASLSSLLLEQPIQQINQLAQAAGTAFKNQANTANLIPLEFQSADVKPDNSSTTVAKVISAIERVEAIDYFEQMCKAVSQHLVQRDCDEDDIESALDSLAAEQEREDSQINRFLNFLDDEALARVRLTITFQIMEAIAENAQMLNKPDYQLLAEYINRVLTLFELAKETSYTVDLTAHFGNAAEFDLLDYLSKAIFYSCLPVWAEWKTQIFEEKVRNQAATSSSYGVIREVSYRFRVNGQNPELGKPAFEGRLDQIRAELIGDNEVLPHPCRRLAELIFLAVVVPKEDEASLSKESLSDSVQQLLKTLKTGGVASVSQVLQDLEKRAPSMELIAIALISILRTKSQKIISQVQHRSSQQFICVNRDIIEWSRLEGAESGVRDLLVGPQQRSREQVEWFKYIEIRDRPEMQGLLFSVKVNAQLSEYNLATKGNSHSIQVQRLLPKKILQICWVPCSSQQEDGKWVYKFVESAKAIKGWVLPAAIQVEYDIQTLKRRPDRKGSEESKQYHAAAVTAFIVLVYCCLWRIIQRLKQSGDLELVEFTTLMLRVQEIGKQSDEGNGDSYVYAAAQALEAILSENTPIRMQGVVLQNLESKNSKYIKLGIFNALLSAFPIAISTPTPPTVPKIGLISYATRPCDEINCLSEDEKGYLFLTQSYIATAINQPFSGYELKMDRMQSDVVNSPERLRKQRLVQEEIGYLKAKGCQHIILLSHAYGGRRINRAADYNSPLTHKEFLEEVFQTFPDLTIYTMQRDVFPATRLRKRNSNEAAFEILRAGDHTSFLMSVEKVRVRDVIPVYTFATLFAIQEAQRPQSGFCVYFLVSDQRVSNIDWTERSRQHLVNPEQQSSVHPCLISVLRGLHFIEAERGVQNGQLIPVLDPFSWISPTTTEAAGEVEVLHTRRKGRVLLSYPALLSHVSQVLHRRK